MSEFFHHICFVQFLFMKPKRQIVPRQDLIIIFMPINVFSWQPQVKVPVSAEDLQETLIKPDEGSEGAEVTAQTLDVVKESPEAEHVAEVLSEEAVPEPQSVAAVESAEKLEETPAVEAEVGMGR